MFCSAFTGRAGSALMRQLTEVFAPLLLLVSGLDCSRVVIADTVVVGYMGAEFVQAPLSSREAFRQGVVLLRNRGEWLRRFSVTHAVAARSALPPFGGGFPHAGSWWWVVVAESIPERRGSMGCFSATLYSVF